MSMATLPSQAQIVIIGGGVGGCSIAYHLTKMGQRDVLLLERHELTGGSTWHSAGLIGQLRSDFNLTRMMCYSVELYRQLKDETGQDPGWFQCGSLRLASSPERMESLKRQVGFARSFGMSLELIGPREAQNLFPPMTLDGVLGAAYMPTDGRIDPTGLTLALAAGARARGARILTDTAVTGIELHRGRVRRVLTNRGPIETETVVNAAGQWADEIARMVGLRLPLVSFAHQYLITAPIEGLQRDVPSMRDPDLLVYFREEVGGLVMGGYERDPAPWALDGVPHDFRYQLLPPDWERFTPLMENAIRRVPALESAGIVKLINGPEAFTPDGEFLLGPTAVKGFWVAAGFCAHGLAGAGGVGKVMAEWIVEGQPEWDIWRLDVRRFGSNYAGRDYVLARTLEAYSRHYDVHYPGYEHRSARMLRLSPAYHRERDLGASFGEKSGWERPNWYTPHESLAEHGYRPRGWAARYWSPAIGYEHRAVRERAGLFDETSFSKSEIRGPGAVTFLQRLCANDIDRPVGTVVYTSMLNRRGGIECDVTITRLAEDRFLMIGGTALTVHDLSWLLLHQPEDGSVIVADVTSSLACLGMWGPQARVILEQVAEEDVSNAAFPYLTAKELTVGSVPVLALRVTYVGELGWELYCPMEYGRRLWDTLWEAGQEMGLTPAGYKAIESLRLEKGYRAWGTDIGPDYTPFEAGLDFAVRLDKGNFIGRESLLRQREEGLRHRLCCMVLSDPAQIPVGKEPIRPHGTEQVIGWVTSGGYGYTVEQGIAYGYLPVEFARLGTPLEVEILGERVDAVVSAEPLWDPAGERVRR